MSGQPERFKSDEQMTAAEWERFNETGERAFTGEYRESRERIGDRHSGARPEPQRSDESGRTAADYDDEIRSADRFPPTRNRRQRR